MPYAIQFYDATVQGQVLALPSTLLARYIVLEDRMVNYGPHMGLPHTKALGDGFRTTPQRR
ncbi:hypothetical protein SAMN02982919_01238 [Giesbergeria anulus]|uniref:Uncharacterized protein n=1 Tax=Giesbergeria anulus TaxID=180197 RepID=A0A1H9IWK6_9BURK|nr:hypothetical protein SAMN02982919_01238 [Giesbergeria anulus]